MKRWPSRKRTTRSRINLLNCAVMLFLTLSNSGCASLPLPSPPTLENRSLRISKDFAGFEYQYEVCVKHGLFGNCRESKWVKDTYDLTDPAMRQRLIDMGFVAKVREKITP